jgi:ABC-type phosphate transport system substrate-binding protein
LEINYLSIIVSNNPVNAVCDQLGVVNATRETLWGLKDAPIKYSVYDLHPDLELQQFPAIAGAVAIVYSNRKEVGSQLNLTFDVLSGIFNRTIAFWDYARIAHLNPNLSLPRQPIPKIVRGDSSRQTSIVTDALGFQVESWPDEAVGKLPEWPLGPLQSPQDFGRIEKFVEIDEQNEEDVFSNSDRSYSFVADGKAGVSLGLMRVPYSLGYMEMGLHSCLTDFLEQAHIGTANSKGVFTSASPKTLHATMAGLADRLAPDTLELNLATTETAPGGFPIAGYAYWYIKKSPNAYKDCYQAWLMCKFVEWSYLDPQAAELAQDFGWVVPPQEVLNKTLERLNHAVMCTDTDLDPPRVIPAMAYVPPPYRQPSHNKTMLITV